MAGDDFLAADSGIRQLHARFTDAVWRQDCEAFADCFAREGEWKIAGMHIKGREAVAEACTNLLTRCAWIHVIVGQPILQVDGGMATGRLNMTEYAKMPDGSGWLTLGVYHDRYVDEDGRWRFAWRHWSMKYRGPLDLSGEFAGTPDYGAFPAMPDQDEPTYVRKN